MKMTIKFLMALSFAAFMSSCGGDECATCDVTQVITVDGVETARQTLNTGQEFCGDELDAIRAQESTITQEIGGITQVAVTTVDCN